MPVSNVRYATFHTSVPYTVLDRDGYEEHPFYIDVYIRFFENGLVQIYEGKNVELTQKGDLSDVCHLQGRFTVSDDDVHIEFKRLRQPEEVKLEIPGDGSNYYCYPTTARAIVLRNGWMRVVFHKRDMYVVIASDDDFPKQFKSKNNLPKFLPKSQSMPEIKLGDEWVTFYSHMTEEHPPWNSYDDPYEIEIYSHLRLFQDGRAQVYMSDWSKAHDGKAFPKVHLQGKWFYQEIEPRCYVIELGSVSPFSCGLSWTDGFIPGRYHVSLIDSMLELFIVDEGKIVGSTFPFTMERMGKPVAWLEHVESQSRVPSMEEQQKYLRKRAEKEASNQKSKSTPKIDSQLKPTTEPVSPQPSEDDLRRLEKQQQKQSKKDAKAEKEQIKVPVKKEKRSYNFLDDIILAIIVMVVLGWIVG